MDLLFQVLPVTTFMSVLQVKKRMTPSLVNLTSRQL